MDEKQRAALRALDFVQDGMVVGLGTGSTATHMINALGEKVRAGLKIKGVPTSENTRQLAEANGIEIIGFDQVEEIDLTIDGADEINPQLDMIKGGGGALLREKIVAQASKQVITIVDSSKWVDSLGAFPLPVEIARFGMDSTTRHLRAFGCEVKIRFQNEKIFVTDEGHYLLDCFFKQIPNPAELEAEIKLIPGVMEVGLFIGLATKALIGKAHGVEEFSR